MSETTYSLFQKGRAHLKKGMAAQATVALEKAKRREPDKASIREALGIADRTTCPTGEGKKNSDVPKFPVAMSPR